MANLPRIPGYKLEKKLGEGGMAAVYEGIQEKLNRKVAIKLLDPSLLKNDMVKARFVNEAETAGMLRHSNIISIIDVGNVEGYFYIVMEFLEETLKERMFGLTEFRFPPEAAISILKPIIHALDYAHSVGIIHRDIKTDNIMFRRDGTPVLTDFGIARALESDSRMTRTGISVGTPYYMSPEQCMAEPLDGRSDFYSLGVVFFEMVTGSRPYEADNPTAIAIKHVQEPVPKLPKELSRYQILIDKMMAKKKAERVANGTELNSIIDGLLSSNRTMTLPTPGTIPEPVTIETHIPQFIEKTQPFTALPPQQKPITRKKKKFLTNKQIKTIGLAASIVIPAVIIFIIFYNLGSRYNNETPETSTQPSVENIKRDIQPVQKSELLSQSYQYRKDYNQAEFFYKSGEYEKASVLLQQLKTIRPIKEVMELDSRVTIALNESRESRFNSFIMEAQNCMDRKDYENAKQYLELASQIKHTPELENLEKQLNTQLAKSPKLPKPKTKEKEKPIPGDDIAFETAVKEGTIPAYQKYIDDFATGRHVDEAISKLEKLKEAERMFKESEKKASLPKPRFRTSYTRLSLSDLDSIVKRHGFFDDNFNKSGNYRIRYAKKFIEDSVVIVDDTNGLMWYAGPLSAEMPMKKAENWIKTLNRNRYGGFSDWRFPTVEEAASLLRRNKNDGGLYIDPVFPDGLTVIWTGDLQRPQTPWTVKFIQGILFADSDLSQQQVLPVRSMD